MKSIILLTITWIVFASCKHHSIPTPPVSCNPVMDTTWVAYKIIPEKTIPGIVAIVDTPALYYTVTYKSRCPESAGQLCTKKLLASETFIQRTIRVK